MSGDGRQDAAPLAGDRPVTPVTGRAHAFVDDLDAPRLSGDDHHHLARVLRLRPGAPVTVGDGRGRWRPGVLTSGPDVEPSGDVTADPVPEPPITVAFAVVKGERPELTVQKLTEVGVDRIVPFVAGRTVVKWDAATADRRRDRWAAIARQAAMQCRRTWLPQVDALTTFADVAELPGAALADLAGEPPALATPTVLIGPEGGWTHDERAVPLPSVRVGSHVLRAETAAITAGALLVSLRARLVDSMQ